MIPDDLVQQSDHILARAAWRLIPWYAAVIGGGLAILVAPFVLRQFPDCFVDGRASLLSFAAAGALLALLVWLSVGDNLTVN